MEKENVVKKKAKRLREEAEEDNKAMPDNSGGGDSISLIVKKMAQIGPEMEPSVKDDEEMDPEGGLKDIFNILIPNDVTDLIFKRLTHKDLKSARLVNKRWTALIGPTVTWNPYLFDNEIPQILKFIEKGYSVDQLTVSMLQKYEYPTNGMGFGYVRSIHFLPYCDIMDGKKCKGISEANLTKLLTELKNVEEMRLHSMALNHIVRPSKVFQTYEFPLLKDLQMSTLDTDGPGFDVCLDAFSNTFPSLEKLSAAIFLHKKDQLVPLVHPPKYKEIFEFCVRHKKTLRSFHLDYSARIQPHQTTLAFGYDMSSEEFQNIKTGLKSVQLEEFTLSPSYYEGQARFVFGETLLESQKRLAVLKIINLSRWNRSIWTAVESVISNCTGTLKTIICEGCFCHEDGEEPEVFSCRAINACAHLKDLQISVCGLNVEDVSELPLQIEVLDLGLSLSKEQINFISSGCLMNLRKLILRPFKKSEDSPVPFTTIELFKRILKNCPKLRELILFKKNSEWKKINKFILRTDGLCAWKCPDEMDMRPGYSLICVKKCFNYRF